MTYGWTGVCRPVFKKVPSSNYRKLPSCPLLWWILAENHPFFAIFHQFLDNPPLFMENLPKKGPLFREFWAQKPTHMGGTYPYPQHVMYPPPPGSAVCIGSVDLWRWVSCFPALFDLMMALPSIETHGITMKNLALFRPKLRNSSSTNRIAIFVNYYC